MNYSESQKRRDRKAEINRRFRRMFAVALFMGLIVGFFLGRFAHAVEAAPPEVPVEPLPAASVAQPTHDPITAPEPTTAPVKPVRTSLGTYRVTAYCACEKCCGEWANNRPDGVVYGAAGVELQSGVSCASPLPFGTVVEVEGLGEYVVQDRTAKWVVEKYGENLIDIYFDNHEAACDFGLQHLNVYLKEEPNHDHL